MKSHKMAVHRTIDIARGSGYSVQQIRNLERDGVLPPATRTETGYRVYTEAHLRSALAYRALADGAGPVEAKRIMQAAHNHRHAHLFALLDASHARLDAERRAIALARQAATSIAAKPIDEIRPTDAMRIAELADALGVRTSTLRHWDAAGLVVPRRASPRESRRYLPDDVRDARIVHQLRVAGYRIPTLRRLMPELRRDRRPDEVMSILDARNAAVNARSRALLDGAAALCSLIPPGDDALAESPSAAT